MKSWRIRKLWAHRGGKNQVHMYNLLGIVLLGFLGVGNAGTSPEFSFSASAIFPRYYMVENQEDQLYWRTSLDYSHQLTNSINVNMSIAGSPETFRQDQTLQIYNASLNFDKKSFNAELGRFTDWSPFAILRIDGAKFVLKNNALGHIAAGGGVNTVFHSSLEAKPSYFISYTKKISKLTFSGRYWSRNEKDFAGGYFSTGIAGFKLRGLTSFNLTDSSPSYTKIAVLRGFGNHQVNFSYRQFRKSFFPSYPWDDSENAELPPMIAVGYAAKLGPANLGIQNFTRLSEEGTNFIRGYAGWLGLHASLHIKASGNSNLTGGTLGWQSSAKNPFRLGVSGSFNALEIDGISLPKNSSGVYGWLSWQPNKLFAVRLFTRYNQNSYYEVDGRGGISIRVAL